MPISSFSSANSIMKPGVCTSTTRPASPYDGQVVYETDTDRVAVYDSSAWVYKTNAGAPALTLVKSQTIGSAVTSVTVSNAFSATYDRYLVTLCGGSATTGRALNLTLGSASTNYYSSMLYITYNSSTVLSASNNGGSSFADAGVVTADSMSGRIEINGPFLAQRTDVTWQHGGTGSASQAHYTGSGFLNDNTSYTGFTLTMAGSGTMTGGTIRVYGYSN